MLLKPEQYEQFKPEIEKDRKRIEAETPTYFKTPERWKEGQKKLYEVIKALPRFKTYQEAWDKWNKSPNKDARSAILQEPSWFGGDFQLCIKGEYEADEVFATEVLGYTVPSHFNIYAINKEPEKNRIIIKNIKPKRLEKGKKSEFEEDDELSEYDRWNTPAGAFTIS